MGWIEDSVDEFRKLPPAGKIAVGGAAVGVAILAIASYRARSAGGAAGSVSGQTVTGAFPGAAGGFSSVTDSAGGIWTTPPVLSVSLLNGDGLPNRTVNTPSSPTSTSSTPPPTWIGVASAHIQSSARAPLSSSPPASVKTSVKTSFIPTTIRPLPTPGRGRVA